jgi:FtsZ-binding cell division protein ZapB
MMEETRLKEMSSIESLTQLEDKIRRMADAFQSVIQENNNLKDEMRNLREQIEVLKEDLERRDERVNVLQGEREEVKARIRKILGMI